MKKIGIFEGKTQFSALIEQARAGETIVVTKNGHPVAQIGPVVAGGAKAQASEAMRRLLACKATLGKATVRELVDEGRRY